ncbi:MAG: winged helix-turn-helix transcriptional regulator [Candidatus Thorarchaeota archaeon]
MRRLAKKAVFVLSMALMISGFMSIFLASQNSIGPSIAVQESSLSNAFNPVTIDYDMLFGPMSFGTSVLFPSVHTTAFTPSSFFSLAIGTVVVDRRSEKHVPRLLDRVVNGIAVNPGIHLRELQRYVGCAMGALQYHVKNLETDGLVVTIKSGNSKHFFLSAFAQDDNVLTLTALSRNPTIQSILLELVDKGRVTQADLSRTLELDKSLISYYTSTLVKADVLNIVRVFGRERPVILTSWASSAIMDLALV